MIIDLRESHQSKPFTKPPLSENPSIDYQNVQFVINETPA